MKPYPTIHQRIWLRSTGLRETLWILDVRWIGIQKHMVFKNWINN